MNTADREASRERWVRRTRESTLRHLVNEGIPLSANAIENNLDITHYTAIGLLDHRTQREISAALRSLVQCGWAKELSPAERGPEDPPGKLYVATLSGRTYAATTDPSS